MFSVYRIRFTNRMYKTLNFFILIFIWKFERKCSPAHQVAVTLTIIQRQMCQLADKACEDLYRAQYFGNILRNFFLVMVLSRIPRTRTSSSYKLDFKFMSAKPWPWVDPGISFLMSSCCLISDFAVNTLLELAHLMVEFVSFVFL